MQPGTVNEEQNEAGSGAHTLWASFAGSANQHEYCHNWLALQCRQVPTALQGVLVLREEGSGSFVPSARWPAETTADGQDPGRLAEVCERVIEERCGLLVEMAAPSATGGSCGIAYPVLVDTDLQGVVALEVAATSEEALQTAMEQLQWGVSWLELLFRRQRSAEESAILKRLKAAVDLLAGVLAEERFEGAAMAFVTELAAELGCDRVSLGFMRRRHVLVQAVSHSAGFAKRMNLTRAIAAAMEEAIVQRREVLFPAPQEAEALIVRNHAELARQHGMVTIFTLPLYGNDRYYGALTFERPAERPFEEREMGFCRSVAALSGPALEDKRQNDRHILRKIEQAGRRQVQRLFGPRYPGRKLLLLLLSGLALFFSLATGDYRLAADTSLEGAVRRVVVAPFNGYISEAGPRAGDLVKREQLLCTLDDRDLRLERLNGLSQRSKLQRQYQEAKAKHDQAQANIISAELEQAETQLHLTEAKLERTRILAPFDGLLVSGDLSQRLGAAVEQGEVLFETTPLDAYRVILKVDERRIADVREGQGGTVLLSSLPNESFAFQVEKITPIATAEEGRNYFRVEARLDKASPSLRPGMEGVGKIMIERRRLIAIWTRSLIEWLRLWVWSWWP